MTFLFVNGQSMALKITGSNTRFNLGFVRKADFVLLIKAQITRKKIILTKLFFVNYVKAGTSNSLQYLI